MSGIEERRAECKAHKEKTEELRKVVFGNGRLGIAYDMVQVKFVVKVILGIQLLTLGAVAKAIFGG